MTRTIQQASQEQYTATYGIMALAGDHMHRTLNLSHWYPFPPSEWYIKHAEERDVFGVYDDEMLVGTFMLGDVGESYYEGQEDIWREPERTAHYFSAFVILPCYQQQGIGSWVMSQVNAMVKQRGHDLVRFDGVATHTRLVNFYTKNGYDQRGILDLGRAQVMCFEKYL